MMRNGYCRNICHNMHDDQPTGVAFAYIANCTSMHIQSRFIGVLARNRSDQRQQTNKRTNEKKTDIARTAQGNVYLLAHSLIHPINWANTHRR